MQMRETLAAFCAQTGRRGLVEQWCAARNAPLAPGQVSYGSKRKVWWRCERGHTWQASVCARTGSGTGCPVCAGKARARAGPPPAPLPLVKETHTQGGIKDEESA